MGRKRTPRAATDVVQWLARVREVSGRSPRRTLILTLWADNDAAKQAMRDAVPSWREGSADGDLYAEATEEFGVWGGLNPAERHTGTQRASSYVSAERVLELLRSHRWLTRAQVARRVGMSPDAARRALYRLKDHGLAHNDHGYWWATKVTESAEGSYEAAERAS